MGMKGIAGERVRRVVLVVCALLLIYAVLSVLSVGVGETHGGTVETLNGQSDTAPLAVPLLLFVIGAGGFLAALGWRPNGRDR